MNASLIESALLIEACRDLYVVCQFINPGLDQEAVIGRTRAAIESLVPNQPDAWLDNAVAIVAEQEGI